MQNRPKIIIITGSIGTGKSTAVNILKDMGYKVLDSDKIVHDSYNIGTEVYKKLLTDFGNEILNADFSINRQKLGKIVFSDENKLETLNELVHENVVHELLLGIHDSNDKILFLDIPLALEKLSSLIRKGLIYDEIWVVYVSPQIQRKRLKRRALYENKDAKYVLDIVNKQISIDKKVKMADEIINNEGTLDDLKLEITKLLKKKGL